MQDKEATRAGFGPRAAAYLIDRALLLIVLLCLRAPFRVASLLGAGELTAKSFLFRYSVLDVVCWLAVSAYFVLLTYFSGSTLGKKMMKLSVCREDGAPLRFIDVLYRETVGRFLSGILCIGYLMTLVDKRSRAFHDWLCGTCVVYDGVAFRPREKAAAPERAAAAAPGWSVPGQGMLPGGAEAPKEALPEAGETDEADGSAEES